MEKIIRPIDNNNDINSINEELLTNKLNNNGYVILRGFNTSIQKFSDFVKRNSSKITLDPAREFHSESAQKVDAGTDKVGLHLENGNGPLIPDYCWFYCNTAPIKKSPTTVCDGKIIHTNLPPHLLSIFKKNNTIIYSRNVAESVWKKYVSHQLHLIVTPEEVTEEHLALIQKQLPNLTFKINADGSLFYQFETSPIINRNTEKFFANSILGPSFNYEKPIIKFKNGLEISEGIKKELTTLTDKYTIDINWEKGDILLIDNKRVMHGRSEIKCNHREIFNALSFKK